jgi:hypothetical protein
MSDKSPLFVSSLELIAHSVELYRANNPRQFKFVILHLANSVELILKDLVIDKGQSIYVPKQPLTIGIWKAFEILEEQQVTIPERPVIELLVDDRNTIQHRFGYPNAESVFYYIEQVLGFFKRLLADEYGLDLSEVLKLHLSDDDMAFLGLADQIEANENGLDPLFKVSPESAVLKAYNLIETRYLEAMLKPDDPIAPPLLMAYTRQIPRLLHRLADGSFITPEAAHDYNFLRNLRNRSAHAAHFQDNGDNVDWRKGLQVAKDILHGMDKAIAEGFDFKPTQDSL